MVGLVSGGVPASVEVATRLQLPLDLALIARLLAPQPEDPIGAVSVAGRVVIDRELPPVADPPQTPLDHHLTSGFRALEEKTRACRGDRPPLEIAGLTVLLVDCGARTGKTIRAAIRGMRRLGPSRIITALPAAAPEARDALESSADEVICLRWPSPFGNVAMSYRRFDVPALEQIRSMVFESTAR